MERNIEEIARQSLLYDFYGQLLTPRQRQIMELYVQENLSLGEIAEELEISRQGVHDALRNGQRSLEKYEEKLALVGRFLRTASAIESIDERILDLIRRLKEEDHRELIGELQEIKSIIDGLEE